MRSSCRVFAWGMKPGLTIQNPNPSGIWWNGAIQHPQRRNSKVSWKNYGYKTFAMRRMSFLKTSCFWGGYSELWLLYWNNNKSECLPLLSLSHKKIVWSVTALWQC
jgi:hypothetical protein